MKGVLPYGCGHCGPCLANRRRVWQHRIKLEHTSHKASVFVTLTYNDQNLPPGESVWKREVQLFHKRLRKLRNLPHRHFTVGEYGDRTWRPHYHSVLFGLSVVDAPLVQKAWGKGFSQTLDLSTDLVNYITGYVSKSMTRDGDVRLEGRAPEFALMSLKPGIGADAIDRVSWSMSRPLKEAMLTRLNDVPSVLRHGGKDEPLGRYLKARWRFSTDVVASDESARVEEMRELFARAASLAGSSSSLSEVVAFETRGDRGRLEGRLEVQARRQRRKL